MERKYELDDLPGEIWVDIKSYEGLYEVSNMGRVKSLKRKTVKNDRILHPYYVDMGVRGRKMSFRLCNEGIISKEFMLGREVARHFLGFVDSNLEVIHIDGNVKNNRYDNLKIVNDSEKNYEEHKRGGHIKKVIQKTINGEVVKIRDQYGEAGKYYRELFGYKGKGGENIYRCLCGDNKTAFGYKREYVK